MGKKAPLAIQEQGLFELDSTGSRAVRDALVHGEVGGRHRRGVKPLRSDLVLQERLHQGEPALVGRKKKDRLLTVKDKKRLQSTVKSKGWDGEQPSTARARVPPAPKGDLWSTEAGPSTVKAPPTLRKHDVLDTPLEPIRAPHAGLSYNPTLEHHQQLLRTAADEAQAEDDKQKEAQQLKDRMDAARKARTKEGWELYQDEVGSGESGDEAVVEDVVKPKAGKKTVQQRKRRLKAAEEAHKAAESRRLKKLSHALTTLPSLKRSLASSTTASSSRIAAKLASRRKALAQHGLLHRRPPAHDVQLTEDLSEAGLRGLKTEGSLWREWETSARRRGLVEQETSGGGRGRIGLKGTRGQKGRGMREVEKPGWRNFER